MKLPITGGCLCGAIRYMLKSLPKGAGFCHCRTCQRATGSAYFPFLHVLDADLEITGQPTEFSMTGSSGMLIHRAFCGKCGSLLFGKLDCIPGHRNISASSLDHPSEFKPQVDIWTEECQHWDYLNPSLKKYERNPVYKNA